MADRSDKLTITFTRYEDRKWPLTKLFGKWVTVPFSIRKLGTGRYALDTVKGFSLILENWTVRNKI